MSISFFQYVITHTHRNIYFVYWLCVVLKFTVSFGFFKVSHISYKNTALFLFQSMVVWTRMVPKCLHICMLSPQLMDCLKRTKRVCPCWSRCVAGDVLWGSKSLSSVVHSVSPLPLCYLWIKMWRCKVLSYASVPCLSASHYDNELTLWNCKQATN